MARLHPILPAVLLLAGCGGGGHKRTPPPDSAPKTVRSDSGPKDVRVVVRTDRGAETAFLPPADPDRQRVTLINRTRFDAVITGRSASGGGARTVRAGGHGSVGWKRSFGRGRLRTTVRFPGHPALTSTSTTPIG